MAKKFSLYRLSLTSDSESTTLDRIDFNNPGVSDLKNTKKENAWLLEFERPSSDGVGDDQPAEENLGSVDALGSTEDVYILKAVITKTTGDLDNGQNQFLILLDLWDSEPKKSTNWPEGRFGVLDDNDHTNDLIPVRTGSNQIGLVWESYTKKTNLSKNQSEITIRFRVSRGDGT